MADLRSSFMFDYLSITTATVRRVVRSYLKSRSRSPEDAAELKMQENERLSTCPMSSIILDDEFLQPRNAEEVRRCVVIDAPNIMHITKTDHEPDKASSAGLLALIRYFVKNNFDVIAVSQRKYTLDATVTHKFAVEKLERMGLIHLVDGHEYDDIITLEIAFASDGVIISNDQFMDHMQSSDRYLRLLERCISVEPARVAPEERYTLSLNGHCLAEHTFGFRRRNIPKALVDQNPVNTLHGTSHSEAFFSTPDNRRHEIVMEHRENWTEDHRDKIIATIDELLAQIRSIV